MKRTCRTMIPLLSVGLMGCAGAQLNRGVVHGRPDFSRRATDVPVRGFGVKVELVDDAVVRGELLAIDEQAMWVHTASGALAVPRASVREVTVTLHDSHAGGLGAWTGLGATNTLTHGWVAGLTVPVWLAGGLTVTGVEAASGRETVTAEAIDALYQFARFPQGPPPSLRVGAATTPATAPAAGGAMPTRRPALPAATDGPQTVGPPPPAWLPGQPPAPPPPEPGESAGRLSPPTPR